MDKLKKADKLIILCILFVLLTLIINFVLFIKTKNNDEKIRLERIYDTNTESDNFLEFNDKQKIGSIFMIGISGKTLNEETRYFLRENKIAGVVLLSSNIESEEQLKKLTNDLKSINKNMLIAIDQEGGTVTRIKWDKYAQVSARDIGNKQDLQYAYDVAFYRANLLKELGINTILGPVADIAYEKSSFMYDRSFGSDVETVSKFVETTVRAQKDAGIITVLKHFPGHGKTEVDSHKTFPVINVNKQDLIKTDFVPFERGIKAGAQAIMLAHVLNNFINPDIPSSISIEYYNILRNDLKFDGLIFTDDLKMTGKIEGGIGWGINLVIEDNDKILKRIEKIELDENEYQKIQSKINDLVK